ncbi:uncharacterized protein LOC120905577 [Anopheles arabiensis]|uniref:uncharacterized protein LOC120905577 n=1 Tax=Anopheles arabiensis TaxID=7173 RepID=UPI001AADDF0D|nr:uncharacterized protein LOC120905577 [Anopheles arabiensis]
MDSIPNQSNRTSNDETPLLQSSGNAVDEVRQLPAQEQPPLMVVNNGQQQVPGHPMPLSPIGSDLPQRQQQQVKIADLSELADSTPYTGLPEGKEPNLFGAIGTPCPPQQRHLSIPWQFVKMDAVLQLDIGIHTQDPVLPLQEVSDQYAMHANCHIKQQLTFQQQLIWSINVNGV